MNMPVREISLLQPDVTETTWPVLVCALGPFRLVRAGQTLPVREGGKTKALLCELALSYERGIPRDMLLEKLWPGEDAVLSVQSLHSLVHSLQKLLSDALGGASPLVHEGGAYQLNAAAGVGVDVAWFDALAKEGDRHARACRTVAAAACYRRAVELYRGDFSVDSDIRAVVERERLRACYLTLLAHLADHYYDTGDYDACLRDALRLLAHDPCREDAHRLVMRCHVRCGERAQAMRQYRLCEQILRDEFDAAPEAATVALFERIRLDAGDI